MATTSDATLSDRQLQVGDRFRVSDVRRTLGRYNPLQVTPGTAAMSAAKEIIDDMDARGVRVDAVPVHAAWLDGFDYEFALELTVLEIRESASDIREATFAQFIIGALAIAALVLTIGWSLTHPVVEGLHELNDPNGGAAKAVGSVADAVSFVAIVVAFGFAVYLITKD